MRGSAPERPRVPSRLDTLAFYIHNGAVFDLWVDDLEFYWRPHSALAETSARATRASGRPVATDY